MNLAARGAARQREKIVMRFGCFLVTLAVLASLVFYPPKAKAFAMTSSAVTALAGGFLNACGLAPVVSGMSSSGEVNESLARLIQEYLSENSLNFPTPEEWLGQQIALTVTGGKVHLPQPVAKKLGEFAVWVAGKYGTKPGENVVYNNSSVSAKLSDGSLFLLTVVSGNKVISLGDYRLIDPPLYFASGYSIRSFISGEFHCVDFYRSDGTRLALFGPCVSGYYLLFDSVKIELSIGSVNLDKGTCAAFGTVSGSLVDEILGEYQAGNVFSFDVSETLQEVLDRLTALEEGQSIALDVGATQSMEIQDILQGILDAILAGDLAASAEVVDEAVEPVEPDPPVVPVVPEGLDKLGAALTSRFPFSIPWDVYKGVTLLAAPPKAPYFEVDFMAPIAHRVGGWKGSTKIVLDFSEYEIIGQVCRWTSTIGFCLMLAAGTKRLIWTA